MKTYKPNVLFIDPSYTPTKEECYSIVEGMCPNCKHKDKTMALESANEFTNFFSCWECRLTVHKEVIEIVTGEKVESVLESIVKGLRSE